MHHFIFPSQDTWISSGSNTITGESFRNQNFGRDQILEIKKEFFNSSFHYPTRALVNFNGTRPDLFKDEAEVIVEGNYINGVFVADQLQTKCASRYEGELKEDPLYKPQST